MAGLVGDPITKKYPVESNKINDIGVKNIINICSVNKVKRFIFISTCSNYGLLKNNQIADEESILNPLSSYAKSKVMLRNTLSLKIKLIWCNNSSFACLWFIITYEI